MQLLTIDFETYYDVDYSLDKLTTEQYVRNPLFEVIGVGVSIPSGLRHWMEERQWRVFAASLDWSQYGVLCQHAHFDGLIMSHHYRALPGMWLDTLSMARALYQTDTRLGLEQLMQFLGVGKKGTYYLNMKGKRRSEMTMAQWLEYGDYCLNDCTGTEGVFSRMLPLFPRRELDVIDMSVRQFTEPVFVLNEDQMREYSVRELARRAALFEELGISKKTFSSSDKFANLLRENGVEPPMKKSPKWIDGENEKMIYAFAKSDPAMQMLLEDQDDTIRTFAEARIESKSTQAVSRTQRFLQLGAGRQPMPVYTTVYGAHTFRDSGGDKCNWKNLKRAQEGKPDADIIKRSIEAPDGYVVVRADSSQIEARFTAWAAREQAILSAFRSGADIYSEFASKVYGRPVDRKNVKADFIPGFVGKTCILGLGYGMGWYKLAMEFLKGALGGPPLVFTRRDMEMFGIDPTRFMHNPRKVQMVAEMPSRLNEADLLVHCIVCEYIVNRYRDENTRIVELWDFLNNSVIPWMAEGRTGPIFSHSNFATLVPGGIAGPSGLVMKYPDLRREKKRGGREGEIEWTYRDKPGRRSHIYGGLLLENLVQRSTRDIVIYQALDIRDAGLPVKTTTYDEIVGIAPEHEGPQWVNLLVKTMKTAPQWCSDLPLGAEGGWHKTYGGAK